MRIRIYPYNRKSLIGSEIHDILLGVTEKCCRILNPAKKGIRPKKILMKKRLLCLMQIISLHLTCGPEKVEPSAVEILWLRPILNPRSFQSI